MPIAALRKRPGASNLKRILNPRPGSEGFLLPHKLGDLWARVLKKVQSRTHAPSRLTYRALGMVEPSGIEPLTS
jgi:hypothetical protein